MVDYLFFVFFVLVLSATIAAFMWLMFDEEPTIGGDDDFES